MSVSVLAMKIIQNRVSQKSISQKQKTHGTQCNVDELAKTNGELRLRLIKARVKVPEFWKHLHLFFLFLVL